MIRRANQLGYSEEDFQIEEARLADQWGFIPPPGDTFWALANGRILSYGNRPRANCDIQAVYLLMAVHLRDEGLPHESLHRLHHEHLVLCYMEDSLTATSIGAFFGQEPKVQLRADRCCDTCALLHDTVLTFEAALAESPLPQPSCSQDWCTCRWRQIWVEL